ncbi:MAG: hypothetical protein ACOCXA_08080 [Planctomycetota bacterium]
MTTTQIVAIPLLLVLLWLMLQVVKRPLIGLGVLLSATVLFLHYEAGPPSMFFQSVVYDNFNKSLGIPGLVINPPEILLSLISLGWLLQALAGKLPGRPLRFVSILGIAWFCVVAFAGLWGYQSGGSGKIGLWLLRPVAYFLLTGFLTYQLVRTPQQAKWLLMVVLVCIGIRTIGTVVQWWTHRLDAGGWERYAAHEDTSIALYLFWIAFGAFFMSVPQRLRTVLYVVAPIALLAIIFNDRRVNFGTMLIGCVLIGLAMPRRGLARRANYLLIGGLVFMLYLGVAMFGPDNALTRPVRGLKTALVTEVRGRFTDTSSEYRKWERYDLIQTIRAYPLLGAGLGVEYLQPIPLPDLGFQYYVYIPHNQVLGTHALMGPHAYFILLFFFFVLFTQLLTYHRRLEVDWHRLLALAAAASVVNWLIVGYYDMQLFYFRNSIFMGAVVALPAALMQWQAEQEVSRLVTADVDTAHR